MKQLLVFIVLFMLGYSSYASTPILFIESDSQVVQVLELEEGQLVLASDSALLSEKPVKFKRGKAIIFTILTGLLGGHRIYLGTHHRTPIIYSITLGGLGILPFVDLLNLIFTKDISGFEHKSQIIMWGK